MRYYSLSLYAGVPLERIPVHKSRPEIKNPGFASRVYPNDRDCMKRASLNLCIQFLLNNVSDIGQVLIYTFTLL